MGTITLRHILSKAGEKIQSQRGGAINLETNVWRLTYVFPELEDPGEPSKLLIEKLGGQTSELISLIEQLPIHLKTTKGQL